MASTLAIEDVAEHAEKAGLVEIERLASQIDDSDKHVQALAQQTSQISRVIDVIRGIAEQTNLLALNAAIEAARAGESGRGFAVVADEVRNLAQKTAASTKEINEIINNLQQGSRTAASSMQSSRTSVDLCVADSQRTTELLGRMAESIEAISQMNRLIATATQQQAAVSGEIKEHLHGVQGVAEQNSQHAQGLQEDSTSLLALAQHLAQLTNRIRGS